MPLPTPECARDTFPAPFHRLITRLMGIGKSYKKSQLLLHSLTVAIGSNDC